MDSAVRIAVVGAGVIGRTHVETLGRMAPRGEVRLSAIVDPMPAGRALAAGLGVPAFDDAEALVEAGAADAAIVATPNETHLPLTAALIGAGLPVLLEKPVAESLQAARALVALQARLGVPVLVGHHRRSNPIVARAREAIAAGEIGDLVMASVTTSLAKPAAYFDMAWRRSPGAGGPLLINLIHEIDMLRHFFGEIVSVQAIVSNAQRGFAVEDGAAVALRFAGGGLGTVAISDAAAGPWAWDLTAGENPGRFPAHPVSAHHYAGSRGGLSLPDLTLWRHDGPTDGPPDWTRPMRSERLTAAATDAYEAQIAHFADLVTGRADHPRVSLADGTANLAVIEAIRTAGATGRVAEVDLSGLTAADACVAAHG
ncbi:Gfo/Idh/MocA family oxidoreductase [Frigidibacter sp. MR17.14]|uniref:Gfo/Idh/MocA family protein n=1 Tax=Frigidibacter sp. MR17.14 TaxID=3126509 RepID=UPI003012F2A4